VTPDTSLRPGRSPGDSLVAGVLTGAVVVVVAWASGFGHLLIHDAAAAVTAGAQGPRGAATRAGTALPAGGAPASTQYAAGSSVPASAAWSSASTTVDGKSSGPASSGLSTGASSQSPPASQCSAGLADAVADPFIMHVQHGHLGESPAQQVGDILNTSQYVQTHTVLVENMTNPLWLLIPAVTEGVQAFVTHVYHGHLSESPSQQAADILDPDQYVQTHTVLIENMTSPAAAVVTGSC